MSWAEGAGATCAQPEGVVERTIKLTKRHPFGAVVAGLVIGLAALALRDRFTRKW